MSFEDWNKYIQTPEGGYAKVSTAATTTTASTPSRLRNRAFENIENIQNQQHQQLQLSNDKKRGPSTPLTPTLIQKNIVKKQFSSHERRQSLKSDNRDENKSIGYRDELMEAKENNNQLDDELKRQESEGGYIFSNSNKGSPISRKATPLGHRKSDHLNTEYENLTPKISKGIKLAVKENKKSRLQIVKDLSNNHDTSMSSESEYSEVSTIAGDTPNYKIKDQNLIYYKNGYYLNSGDDSILDCEKENVINKKELNRVNDLLEFMSLERQFERELE